MIALDISDNKQEEEKVVIKKYVLEIYKWYNINNKISKEMNYGYRKIFGDIKRRR